MSMPDPRQYRILALVANSEVQQLIRSALLRSQWKVDCVPSLPAALEVLPLSDAAVVICCQETAGDQSWRSIARALSHFPRPPFLVVASRLADEDLWQDVLTSGGYDVLSLPFDKRDLFRVLSLAGSYWRARRVTPVQTHEHAIA
jgi:CheY-like chemotaxis protein